jgi:hypothetical protein
MQLILVKIKWHIKWKYLIQKFHDICLSYYFKIDKIKTNIQVKTQKILKMQQQKISIFFYCL